MGLLSTNAVDPIVLEACSRNVYAHCVLSPQATKLQATPSYIGTNAWRLFTSLSFISRAYSTGGAPFASTGDQNMLMYELVRVPATGSRGTEGIPGSVQKTSLGSL